jgi:hypothetical protein
MQNPVAHTKRGAQMFTLSQIITRHTLIISLILLAGCGPQKPTYSLKSLQPHTRYDQLTKKTETGEITVRCATCTRKDIQAILGKSGDVLFSKYNGDRIVPVQLYIENNSAYTWLLSPYDIQLPLTKIEKVKDRFIHGATARGLASFTVASGLGITIAGLGAAASIFHPIIGASMIGFGCSIICIAPLRSHSKTAHISAQNMHFTHVLDAISLHEPIFVHPHEQVNKLFFVEHEARQETFIMRLSDRHNPDHTISYNLSLERN